MKRILVLVAGMIAAAIFVVPAFAQGTGFVEICKASGSPGVTGTFSFMINGSISATADAGECTAPIAVPDGTATVVETNYTDANGFATNDYTAVSAIHTSQPGGPDEALSSFNLAGRSAVVDVVGGDESTTTIVTFTNMLVQGYVEVCKAQVAGAGLDGQSFSYTIQGAMGFAATANVLVGACSNPIYAPAGHVNIAEGGASAFVTSISTQPGNRLLDSDLGAGTATVAVTAAASGAVSGESIVTFTNNSAQLKICKVAGDEALIGQSYTFTANGTATFSVTAGAGAGHCVLAGRYRAGTSITVVETPSAGQAVDDISILPSSRTFVRGGSDFLGQSATVTLGSGETVLTYTNVLASPGLLKICKAGAGTGLATFTVAGPRGTAPGITQGTDTVMVPVGGCALAPSSYPYAGIQTITETPMAGFSVSSITVADADRLAGTPNLAGGSVGAFIGSGVTVATFTNVAGTATPPAGGGTSPTTPAAAPKASSSASTTAVSAPKATKKASVAKVQIVSQKSGRYVVVRVSGAAKTARIKVTLIGTHSKVLKVALRTVKTNRAVKVGNLKLGPAVRSVRVAVA
jgi:hypothetical protein